MPLSPYLQPIYDLEISLGNEVGYTISNEMCGMYIAFSKPLHREEIERRLVVPAELRWQEYRDTHYSLESGYVCSVTNHVGVGPLVGS